MILLTGAGGKTGRTLIQSLSNAMSVCAFAHREEQVPDLKSLGAAKVIVGDLRDEAAIRTAMKGASMVYHICPNMSPDEVVLGRLMIGEAGKAGVRHFVYHSVLHPQVEVMNHHWQKMRVEEMLFDSGLPFTILQPAPYMQNLLAGWKSIIEEGVLRVPYSPRSKFSFLDLQDLAEAAKIVLTEPGHVRATYELAGTPPISHADVAAVIGRVLGREVRAEKEEIEDWKFRASGLTEYTVENLVRMFEYYDRSGLVGNVNVLRWVLQREPASLESFLQRMLNEPGAGQ